VVQILDAVFDDEAPYLVMEYVNGVTLRRFCRADALLPLEQIVEIGFKCAMALGYVYRQGLIHRDVKPANLLAVMDGDQVVDVKITDFGSAFNQRVRLTQVYRVGSLAYMSPEQLDGDTLDCRADIYSLAAVLYHLIAGRPPFDATRQQAIMHQIYHQHPPSLRTLREGVAPPGPADPGRAGQGPGRPPDDWDRFAQALSALITDQEVPRGHLQGVLDSERFNLLRSLEFFQDFGDVELWEVVHRARWQRLPFGHAIYRKGQEGDDFHIIASGERRRLPRRIAGGQLGAAPRWARWPTWRPARTCAAQRRRDRGRTGHHGLVHAAHAEQLSMPTRHLFDERLHQGAGAAAARRPRGAGASAAHPLSVSVAASRQLCRPPGALAR
jgi:serine/threonine protein kinase